MFGSTSRVARMAAPLQQPRVEGAGTRGRDEGHAALVSSRKRPRVVAETHDDSVAFARAASLRASDYGAWLSECKTRWRSLRNKLALVRNFVKLEANGDSLELGGILDPTGARARKEAGLLALEDGTPPRRFASGTSRTSPATSSDSSRCWRHIQ